MGKIRSLGKIWREYVYSQTPDEKVFAIKPMNCPGHIQVFNQGLKSYRDLTLKNYRVWKSSSI